MNLNSIENFTWIFNWEKSLEQDEQDFLCFISNKSSMSLGEPFVYKKLDSFKWSGLVLVSAKPSFILVFVQNVCIKIFFHWFFNADYGSPLCQVSKIRSYFFKVFPFVRLDKFLILWHDLLLWNCDRRVGKYVEWLPSASARAMFCLFKSIL